MRAEGGTAPWRLPSGIPCGSVRLRATVQEAWRTLRRLPEAAIKPTENSKPFTQQRKPFALSWAWEYILYLPYCSLKNQSFPCFPSFHPLPWLHIFWLPSGVWQERPEVCTVVLGLFLYTPMSDLATDLGGQQHTYSPLLGRGLPSLSPSPHSSGWHPSSQELLPTLNVFKAR